MPEPQRITEYVVFDLEANADRSDPPEHEIIEIGAILISDETAIDRFATLVRPTRPLREFTRELTGITDDQLASAPVLAEALRDFYDYVGDRPLIAHNGFGYDFPLLDSAAEKTGLSPPDTTRLDTLELAHLVFPRSGRGLTVNIDGRRPPAGRSLDELTRHFFGDDPRDRHRALNDARLLSRVLARLLAHMEEDDPARRLQRWVLGAVNHPWAGFLTAQPEPVSLEDTVPSYEPPDRHPPTGVFDIDAVVEKFEEGGALMARTRRPRKQQIEMARHIAITLAQGKGGKHLIEAPTGTGKTLAYLVPAIEYARAGGDTVIVAPHSKVLQEQVMAALEELGTEIDPFISVLLKGQHNYISLDSLAGELDALAESPGEYTQDIGLTLAMICAWVAQTPTGDWSDLRAGALEKRLRVLRRFRLLLRVENSSRPTWGPLDRLDFHRRAREGLRNAHVAVLNHALLVSWDDWLDHSKRLILDEAHNLEDAATDALSEAVSEDDLLTLCDALWDPQHRRGTVTRLANATKWSLREQPLGEIRKTVASAQDASASFGKALVEYLRVRTGARLDQKYPASYRIRPGIDTDHPEYACVLRAGKHLGQALRGIAGALNRVNLPRELAGRYRRDRMESEVRRLGRHAREASRTIYRILRAEDPEKWIAIGEISHTEGGWTWDLRRSPVSVAHSLRIIWNSLEAAILTSATLRVRDSFAHVIDTLGLGAVRPTALDSPFTRLAENHLVLRTDYLPAPRARLIEEFRVSAAGEIPRLLTLTNGRGMVLMTARDRLEFVRDHTRPILDARGIPLMAQGDDSAGALVERMRRERANSLLALRSFWEGVDIPGQALSMLILEKIPFDSPADPVVGARMEVMERRGKDPFADYMVPRAALRFAQGVGRLIRTEDDRGVTVVLDNRLCRAVPYRDRILATLPGPPRLGRANRPEDAYRQIAEHLGDIAFDEQMRQRLRTITSADPWADLSELELVDADLADHEVIAHRLDEVRRRFGFERWRPGQLETMGAFIRGDDVLAVLPTGSGKSITFQIPALLSPGLTLVISPLRALMNDQVENLRARGIAKVATIHSGVGQGEWRDVLRGAARGDYKLLYVSPERLWSQEFVETLSGIGVARIAVDEAHCISQWGHSFRPEYATIPQALNRIGTQRSATQRHGPRRPPILAVTATATEEVRQDVRRSLQLELTGDAVVLSPDRPEIRYYTERCRDRKDRDLRVVQVVEAFRSQPAIVYVPTRKDTTRIAGLLTAAGLYARPYNGGMETPARRHVEDVFRHGEVNVVVATKAFGMGIDKPDIALIVHLEMPATIEEYVQETGRAARGAIEGKEPKTGTAVLLTMPGDCSIHRNFIRGAAPAPGQVRRVWSRIRTGTNPYDPDELDGADDETDRGNVGLALAVHYLQEAGGLQRHLDTVWRGRVSITGTTEREIEELEVEHPELARRGRGLVRLVERLGSEEYRAATWGRELGRPPARIAADLLELNRRDILGFSAWKYAWVLERLSEPDWGAIDEKVKDRQKVVAEKSKRAKRFALRTHGCRRRAMLDYLDADVSEECGRCDLCASLDRPWAGSHVTEEAILTSLPKRTVVLQLLYDTHQPYSHRNLVRTLVGKTYGLPERLKKHPAFGRLSILGTDGVEQLIDQLVGEGLAITTENEYDGTAYETLGITEDGRAYL